MKGALVLVATSALLLSGCTGLFAPDPTSAPTVESSPSRTLASGACSPDTATLTWRTAATQAPAFTAISTRYRDFDTGRKGRTPDVAAIDLAVESPTDSPIFDVIKANEALWNPTLRASARASGFAPRGFGTVPKVTGSSAFRPPQPHSGTWVRVELAPQTSIGLTVRCTDGSTDTGIVYGPVSGRVRTVVLHCDPPTLPNDSALQAVARAQCGTLE